MKNNSPYLKHQPRLGRSSDRHGEYVGKEARMQVMRNTDDAHFKFSYTPIS